MVLDASSVNISKHPRVVEETSMKFLFKCCLLRIFLSFGFVPSAGLIWNSASSDGVVGAVLWHLPSSI